MRETSTLRVVTGVRAAALVVGMVLTVSTGLVAAQHDHQASAPPAQQAQKSDQTADSTHLQMLLDAMNAAPATGKVEAMAAVITALVAERAEMRKELNDLAQVPTRMEGRMQGMMGRMGDMQKMAAECPMMKAKPADTPSGQR